MEKNLPRHTTGNAVACSSVRKYWRQLGIYTGIAVTLPAIFFFLHYTANLLPQERALAVVKDAFAVKNLGRSDYPFRKYGSQSIRSLIGQNQYSDCRTMTSLIAPASNKLADAIVPKKPTTVRPGQKRYCNEEKHCDERKHCEQLYQIAVKGSDFGLRNLKTRYWQGTRALIGNALYWDQLDYFQVNVGIKTMTLFAYLILALVSLAYSRRMFMALIPLVVMGFFFSGIPYYGGFSHSIPHLFAVVSLTMLVVLLRFEVSDHALKWFFFATGMFSAYVFLLDGHLLLLLPLSVVILYFASSPTTGFLRWFSKSSYCMLSFISGFVVSYAANQLAKAAFLGFREQLYNITGRLSVRMLPVTTSEGKAAFALPTIDPIDWISAQATVLPSLLKARPRKGSFLEIAVMGNQDLFYLLLIGSGAALLVVLIITAWRIYGRKENTATLFVVVILIAITIFFVRIAIFPQHSLQHSSFIGRYMFVPLGLCWSALIVVLTEGKKGLWPRPEP